MKKKTLALILCAVLLLGVLPMTGAAAEETVPVDYRYYDPSDGTFKTATANCFVVTEGFNGWEDGGWYVVDSEVSVGSYEPCYGTLNFILLEGGKLTTGFFYIGSVNIYPGINGEGEIYFRMLVLYGSDAKLTLHGGTVNASGTGAVYVHGGTMNSDVSDLTMTGGTVNGSVWAVNDYENRPVTISGGTLNGDIWLGFCGSVEISGGTVTGSLFLTVSELLINPEAPPETLAGSVRITGGTVDITQIVLPSTEDLSYMMDPYMQDELDEYGLTLDDFTLDLSLSGGTVSFAENALPEDRSRLNLSVGDALIAVDASGNRLAPEAGQSWADLLAGKAAAIGKFCNISVIAEKETAYPGDTFTVTVSSKYLENKAVQVTLGYDAANLTLDPASLPGYAAADPNNGKISLVISNVTSETLAALSFTVKDTLAGDTDAAFPVLLAEYGSDLTSMLEGENGNAKTVEKPAENTVVALSKGIKVEFLDKGEAVETQYVIPGEKAAAPTYVPEPDTGYRFLGWALAGRRDIVDVTAAPVNETVTYEAVYGLDVTVVSQDADYIGGYVRVVISGALPNYNYNGNAMYLLSSGEENTFAYLYQADAALSEEAVIAQVTANANLVDSAHTLAGRSGSALYDVNNSGKFDIADVRAVFICQNVNSTLDFDAYVGISLRADLVDDDGAAKVDADDLTAIINALLTESLK